MREKRTRINHTVGRIELTKFKVTPKVTDYQTAKTMLHQGFSLDIVLKKHHLLESERKLLRREEQVLNLQNPNREIITELDEPVVTPQFNIIKKIHNDIVGVFSSNENLRNFALPSVE